MKYAWRSQIKVSDDKQPEQKTQIKNADPVKITLYYETLCPGKNFPMLATDRWKYTVTFENDSQNLKHIF
jgi:hypothetical protein